jgi:hypothetical protein
MTFVSWSSSREPRANTLREIPKRCGQLERTRHRRSNCEVNGARPPRAPPAHEYGRGSVLEWPGTQSRGLVGQFGALSTRPRSSFMRWSSTASRICL